MRTAFSTPDFSLLCWWKEYFSDEQLLHRQSCDIQPNSITVRQIQLKKFSFFPCHCGSHITLTPAGWAQGSLWNLAFVNMSQSSAWTLGFQNKCKSWKFGCSNSKFLACKGMKIKPYYVLITPLNLSLGFSSLLCHPHQLRSSGVCFWWQQAAKLDLKPGLTSLVSIGALTAFPVCL